MRIGCLQFAPRVGDVDNNLNRADAVLQLGDTDGLDLIVLPEMAITGYNFRSFQEIYSFLEPTSAGITSLWARTVALKYNCFVTVGYPEKTSLQSLENDDQTSDLQRYNSVMMVNREGETIANYRKSFLNKTDEIWAIEGEGFCDGINSDLGQIAIGISMDINPYKFQTPWHAWEFAHHVIFLRANLVLVSMAWLTNIHPKLFGQQLQIPDMDTLSHWLSRLEPIIRVETEEEIIVVIANRCGYEGEALYAGTSTVLGIKAGEVIVYGILGRGEKKLLVVDTSRPPLNRLVRVDTPTTIDSGYTAMTNTTPDIERFDRDSENLNPTTLHNYHTERSRGLILPLSQFIRPRSTCW